MFLDQAYMNILFIYLVEENFQHSKVSFKLCDLKLCKATRGNGAGTFLF